MGLLLLLVVASLLYALNGHGKHSLIEKDLRQQLAQATRATPSSSAPAKPLWRLQWKDGRQVCSRLILADTEGEAIRMAMASGLRYDKFIALDPVPRA